jgi:hypothetical protein
MLRKNLLFLSFIAFFTSGSAYSQSRFSFGVLGGTNVSSIHKTASGVAPFPASGSQGFGYEAGISGQYKLGKRAFIRTGIVFVAPVYRYVVDGLQFASDLKPDFTFYTSKLDYRVHDQYLQIPLEFGISIPSRKERMSWYAGFGISGMKYLSSRQDMTIVHQNIPNEVSKGKTTHSVQAQVVALTLFGGVDYKVSPNFHICLEPNIAFPNRDFTFDIQGNASSYFLAGLRLRANFAAAGKE